MARNRRRYKDRLQAETKAGTVKFKPGESYRKRHARRLQANVTVFADEAMAWSDKHSVSMRISNGNHHWIFSQGSTLVEWWPSSAKCVINKNWKSGIHVHEWPQLVAILKRTFKVAD